MSEPVSVSGFFYIYTHTLWKGKMDFYTRQKDSSHKRQLFFPNFSIGVLHYLGIR